MKGQRLGYIEWLRKVSRPFTFFTHCENERRQATSVKELILLVLMHSKLLICSVFVIFQSLYICVLSVAPHFSFHFTNFLATWGCKHNNDTLNYHLIKLICERVGKQWPIYTSDTATWDTSAFIWSHVCVHPTNWSPTYILFLALFCSPLTLEGNTWLAAVKFFTMFTS